MQVCRLLAVTVIVAAMGGIQGSAKTLRADDGPAEYPPASYSANQYVDSRGCVYVRAGYAGQVTWVPRVSRARKVLCGFTPTFAKADPGAAPSAVAAAQPAQQPRPSQGGAPSPAPAPTVFTSKPAANAPLPTVATTTTTPKIAAASQVTAPTPKAQDSYTPNWVVRHEAAEKPAPKTRQMRVVRTVPTGSPACEGASELSQRYINDTSRGAVRCGPQAETDWLTQRAIESKANRLVRTAAAAPQGVVRSAPVLVQPMVTAPATPQPIKIPKGYEAAWSDGRLNPKRGLGTAQGEAEMNLIWTQTVPRQLVSADTGRPATAAQRTAYLSSRGDAQTGSVAQTRSYATRASSKGVRMAKPKVAQPVKKTSVAPSAPVKRTATAASHRFVQVGSFGVPANADRVRARLRSLGLPVSSSKSTRGGKVLQTIYAGPFRTQAQLTSALGAVRKAGYGDALLRK